MTVRAEIEAIWANAGVSHYAMVALAAAQLSSDEAIRLLASLAQALHESDLRLAEELDNLRARVAELDS